VKTFVPRPVAFTAGLRAGREVVADAGQRLYASPDDPIIFARQRREKIAGVFAPPFSR